MAISLSSLSSMPIAAPQAAPVNPAKSSGFGSMLEDSINRVEGFRNQAQESVQKFLTGEQEDLHSVVLSTQRAEMEFELMLQVRNKVVQAYQEIMRMQV